MGQVKGEREGEGAGEGEGEGKGEGKGGLTWKNCKSILMACGAQ